MTDEVHLPQVEPIWTACEGGGCPPNATFNGGEVGMCAMCGHLLGIVGGKVIRHRRHDVLAMIDRGDFG